VRGATEDATMSKAQYYICPNCGDATQQQKIGGKDCANPKCKPIPAKPDNSHYKVGAIDPCQYVEAMGTAEFRGACVLNILKYITRYPYKGMPLMDLAKAQDYLSKLIEHEKAKATDPAPPS